ncbi:HAD-IB family hydrolase [Vibrio sp. ZSDE26]|uniref:HAD-IB family hydrolase n=1 Tax=Vibrio amylolyticus TaxID=2847292 RepID=A0A9X1XGM3_9VIBR|nr:HAD family hydrolase [Vibrio amylolyticus]MCK6262722.1 HAD-IB family hydrolase [Vibrio amylolyticus]
MSQPLYVFDMDETLFAADCSMLWNAFLVEEGIATSESFLEEDKRLMALYSAGKMDMKDYLTFAMSPLSQVDIQEVKPLVKRCISEKIMPYFYPQAQTLLAQLKRDNIDTVIISATVNFIVAEVANHIGIDTAMGIDLVIKENRYTATIEGIPTYREGKVARLEQWLNQQEKPYDSIHFYTDSINDLPLCERADFAYLVNPCERLAQVSERPRWQTLNWTL